MKTLEVVEYLLNEIKKEIDYENWYHNENEKLKNEPCFVNSTNKSKYSDFLRNNKYPNDVTIKQNLKKIRKLTLVLEKELKDKND